MGVGLPLLGYELLYRIINPFIPKNQVYKRPVLLWHGTNNNAEIFLLNRPGAMTSNGVYYELIANKTVYNDCDRRLTSTIAFTLSACRWDVWLANNRGTQYSLGNVNNLTTMGISREGNKQN
jgi:hypothetical protein